MAAHASDTETQLRKFFEEAYWLQTGEFYPETHQANIEKLCREYPWERPIIDALYRILPHFDECLAETGKRVGLGELTPDTGFQELQQPVFYYISEELKRKAWKLHLDREIC